MEKKIEKGLAFLFKGGYRLDMNKAQKTTNKGTTTMSTKTTTQIMKTLKHLKATAEIFETMQAQAAANNKWGEFGTAGYFKNEVDRLISGDHGECGLEAYLKIAAGK